MRIMIGVAHPKQVHFCKNVITNLVKNGHEVMVAARDKDLTLYLLDAYGFDYEVVGTNYKTLTGKAYGLLESDIKVLRLARKFKPDILVGGSPYLAHVSKLIGKPHITFTDTEHASIASWLTFPFTDVVITPSCYKGKVDPKKHVTVDGYFELAYLHPNYFTPDPNVLDDVGLSEDDKFIVIRFVAWEASHDVGQSGISNDMKVEYISKLELKIPPEKFHSLLNYAQLYIGESGAISTEAGILGVPSVYISSLVGTMGNFDELEQRYGLVHSFRDSKLALDKALELLEDENTKKKWQKKREKLLDEKIDVAKFMTEFIENYPERFEK